MVVCKSWNTPSSFRLPEPRGFKERKRRSHRVSHVAVVSSQQEGCAAAVICSPKPLPECRISLKTVRHILFNYYDLLSPICLHELLEDHISAESCVLCISTPCLKQPSSFHLSDFCPPEPPAEGFTWETGTISATKSCSSSAFSMGSTLWISSFSSHHGSELWNRDYYTMLRCGGWGVAEPTS
ncbi:uncharacterized protein LOC144381088 [Halichoerus grypus]